MTRVLVVEDDALTNSEIVAELEKLGFEVVHTQDGREGLALATAGGFDLITLDRLLPSMDGLAIVETIRHAGWETPVLMISALGDVDERIRGLRAGGDDYLTKPFSFGELSARLDALVRRAQQTGSPTVLSVGD
ncbi:MAG TPA: response regulator, partial [Caulobacteraceae bacterium]